jgi:hypothetical protein
LESERRVRDGSKVLDPQRLQEHRGGDDCLWRATNVFSLPVLRELPDGSYLSH